MKPEAVGAVIADDLKQHQWLRLVEEAPQSKLCSGETFLLGTAQLAHQAYAVYQSCVYEAMARGEPFELAPGRLVLLPEGRGVVRINMAAFKSGYDSYMQLLKKLDQEVPEFYHTETPTEQSWIQLDLAVEHHLAADLEPRWFAGCGEGPVAEALTKFAVESVSEIGRVIVSGVGSRVRVQLDFLGSLKWDGESEAVALSPSGLLQEHIRMPQVRHLLEKRRSPR